MEALGINLGFLIAQIVNFGVIFLLLAVFAWRPLMRVLDERAARVAKQIEDADVAAKARANAEQEAQKILQDAHSEAARIAQEARSHGDEAGKTVVAEAEQEAAEIRQRAVEEAEEQRNRMLSNMRGQVASLAMAAAQHLIGEAMDAQKQQALVAEFFASAPENVKNLSGTIEVVSALPLTDAEQEKIRQQTGAEKANFRVDPEILGGLIIRAGDRVIDGSVRSGLRAMSARLN